MDWNRRDFLKVGAATGAMALAGGCASAVAAKRPEPDFYWSYLVHFGINSWKDLPLDKAPAGSTERFLTRCQADFVRFEEDEWKVLSERLASSGCNQLIIDLAEIVEYPSHPELAVKGTWSVDKLRRELARLRGMGFEVIPKMNFSAGHDSWLKEYHRMLSTRKYYEVCADVIRDAIEIFDGPRLFHLGFDEETPAHQRDNLSVTVRQGDLWWHDFNFLCDVIERENVRPWMWSDYIWHHKDEYLKRMSKGVLQSNWYYGAEFDVSKMKDVRHHPYVQAYEWLEQGGFDQVPTGANWSCDSNFGDTIKFCDARIAKSRLKGYMMAPWTRTFKIHHEKSFQAIAIMEKCIRERG